MPSRAIATRHARRRLLYGSGGGSSKGGSSGHTPVEDPDTLRSRSSAKILEILSEGEIDGFVNGLKSVYFDGTPVQDEDTGTDNFKNYKIFFMPGTQDQNYIPDFTDAANTSGVNVQLKHNTPWVHHIVGPELDAIKVNMRFPRLQKVNKKTGDVHGTSVRLTFELQTNGGGYSTKIDDTVKGKSSNGYVRGYKIPLSGTGPWDIRVTRVTDDAATETLSNDTYIEEYSEIVEAKLRYPNTALVGLEFDAEQFGTIPQRSYFIKGLKIKIPTNYDPIARTYATTGPGTTGGVWDGTFVTAWSNNPAWCWYEMITNDRFGLGQVVDATLIDKYALYTIGQYCDAWHERTGGTTEDYTATGKNGVPDGQGAWEPRFTCNVYLQTFEQALNLLRDLATVFRGLTYYSVGLVTAVQDRPEPSIAGQFAPANTLDGRFTYAGSSADARHNLVTVAYNDLTQLGILNYVQVGDDDDIALNGIKELKLTAIGCTSPGQAWRLARWTLLTNQLDNDTITFKTGMDGMHLRPGNVIQTQDPSRSGRALSGRIKASAAGQITTDRSVDIESGKTYQLCTFKADGTIETKNITNAAGTASVLHVDVDYATPPDVNTLWILKVSDLLPELWRVIGATPTAPHQMEIVGLKYNASKFAAADDTGEVEIPPTSVLPNVGAVEPPTNLVIEEVAVNTPFGVQINLHVGWAPSTDQFLRSYRITYRYEEANWSVLDDSATADVTLENAKPGLYEFSVVAINTLGRKSAQLTGEHYVDEDNPLAPVRVTGLELKGQGNDTEFSHPDAKFAWRINSPTQASGITDPLAGAQQDPAFQAYEVTIWNGSAEIWRELVTDPEYTFTLDKNKQANGGSALNKFRIEVRMLDKFNVLTKGERLTVTNPPPQSPFNTQVIATARGANIQWENPDETDLDHVEILMSTDPLDPNPALVGRSDARSTSYVYNNTTGITDTLYFWLREVDTFGNKSTSTFAGSTVPGQAAGDVTIMPDGGTINTATPITVECPDTPTALIYYRWDAAAPTSADNLYNPAAKPQADATHTEFTAVAILAGQAGNPKTSEFTWDPGACQAPAFTPTPGTYATAPGTKDITIATTEAGAVQFWTDDGTTPAHDGGFNAIGTSHKINSTSGVATIGPGVKTLKAISAKSGKTDSSVTSGVYTISADSGGGGGGGGGTPTQVNEPVFIPASGGPWKLGGGLGRPICFGTDTLQAAERMTTDGTTPTSGTSGHGTAADVVGRASILKPSQRVEVIAYKNGLSDSVIADQTFLCNGLNDTRTPVPTPEILIPSGNNHDPRIASGGSVTIKFADLPIHTKVIDHDTFETADFGVLNFALACDMATALGTNAVNIRFSSNGTDPGGNAGTGTLLPRSADVASLEFAVEGFAPFDLTIKACAFDTGGNIARSALGVWTVHFI